MGVDEFTMKQCWKSSYELSLIEFNLILIYEEIRSNP